MSMHNLFCCGQNNYTEWTNEEHGIQRLFWLHQSMAVGGDDKRYKKYMFFTIHAGKFSCRAEIAHTHTKIKNSQVAEPKLSM